MISDREFSERVLSETSECFSRLDNLLRDAQHKLPKPEFHALRSGVGMVLGYLYAEVEAPIFKRHPDLEPEGLRRPSRE